MGRPNWLKNLMGRRSRRRQISNSNEVSTESKKKMENENLDKKECQNPDSGKKSNGSGDEVAENSMKSGARSSAER